MTNESCLSNPALIKGIFGVERSTQSVRHSSYCQGNECFIWREKERSVKNSVHMGPHWKSTRRHTSHCFKYCLEWGDS